MNKALYKDPLVVALWWTLLALMFVPHRWSKFEYRFVTGTDLSRVHWPTLVFEMAVIWGGLLIVKRIIKAEENE